MPRICLLSSPPVAGPPNDNPERLAGAFAAAGWSVTEADHDAVFSAAGAVRLAPHGEPLGEFDLIWLIGLGRRETFLDRMQILGTLDAERFVNTPAALVALHAKHELALGELYDLHPETYASNDPEWLLSIVQRGGEWVVKPTAGSYGREVRRVSPATPGLAHLLRARTGPERANYCIVQRYRSELAAGETRVLAANRQLIGCYRRLPGADHRANLDAGGLARPHALTDDERHIAARVAECLMRRGVRFAAIDIAVPFVVEYNLANPGGLATLENLSGSDPAPAVVEALSGTVK